MQTSVGRTRVELADGDITQLDVDAIVVPSSAGLRMDHGVAAGIKQVAGEAVEKEAVLQGPVAAGEAVVTTGQDLTADWLIHVALTAGAPQGAAALVTDAVRASLRAAERARARSVAVPVFDPGACGLPLYQCSSVMVAEVIAYLRRQPRTPLRRVVLFGQDHAARAALKNALAGTARP